MTSDSTRDVLAETMRWIERHWDPDLTMQDWWSLVGESGLGVPHWPLDWFGRGWSHADAAIVRRAFATSGVPGPPAGLGTMMAGPTLIEHGNAEQKSRMLRPIVTGVANWCQLFSEPGAGSDLPALRTTASRQGGHWLISGQKVWTSNASLASFGMLLARTSAVGENPRQGLTWFCLDMDQPGIEIRPLREMTGRSLFCEVFLDGVKVDDRDVVGSVGDGWRVARSTLAHERAALSSGGAVGGTPGTKAGLLQSCAGDVAERLATRRGPTGASLAMRGEAFETLARLAAAAGVSNDLQLRQRLAKLYALESIARWSPRRRRSANDVFQGTEASLGKLLHSRIVREARNAASGVLGARMLSSDAVDGILQELVLFSPAVSIYGGTDEIQRNLVAEHGLGLPR